VSPYRISAAPEKRPERARLATTIAIGATFFAALTGVVTFDLRASARRAEIEAERAKLRASEDENARRLRELQGSQFGDWPTKVERQKRPGLPRCRCAPGDPLCSEIPGQTCAP
jgi:hypothetical protein